MFPELRFGWHANDGALKSLQGVFQQYPPEAEVGCEHRPSEKRQIMSH
jgi:hypothetical protein